MKIAVDFDGVIIPAGHWPGVGDGDANAPLIEWLKELRAEGHKLILWTNRVGEALDLAVSFCQKHGLEFDAVNDNLPEVTELFGSNARKVYADYYIDDKAVCVKFERGIEAINDRTGKQSD